MIDLAHVAGKYGAYVWPAYGVSLAGMIAMIGDTFIRARRWRREADRQRDGLTSRETGDD